jgi:DNA-directed RNA polymerase
LSFTLWFGRLQSKRVEQFYLDREVIRLKPFTYNKLTYSLVRKTDRVNYPKQVRALMPNLIHSLDAASLFVDFYYRRFIAI